MDKLTEKKQRLAVELVPLARKLLSDPSNTRDNVLWKLTKHARATWLLSSPVARDYGYLALDQAETETAISKEGPVTA